MPLSAHHLRNLDSRFWVALGAGLGLTGLSLLAGGWALDRLAPVPRLDHVAIATLGLMTGAVEARLARSFPAFAGFLTSLLVPLWLLYLDGFQLSLDSGVVILLKFEVHFAALYLAAFVVFAARGGGMAYPRTIGLRYLRFKMVTGISVVGVALGVAALAVVLSVMSGFEADLRSKIIGTNAHAIVQKRGLDFFEYRSSWEKIRRVDGVVAASPFVFGEVMVRAGSNICGVFLKGIDLPSVQRVTPIRLVEGSLDELAADDTPGILVGRELMRLLRVRLGDSITVLSPAEGGSLTGPRPRSRTFRLVGVFHSGMYEFDAKSVYVSLAQAQDFFGLGDSVTGVALKVSEVDRIGVICAEVIAALDGYPFFTRSWHQMNRNLFAALKLQKVGMFIVLVIVILVSAFGVIATLIMLVWEKVKEIAILKSMGATPDGVMKIFMVEGITIALVGTVLGVIIGCLVCVGLAHFGLELDPEVYYIERLPVVVDPLEIVLVALVALHICFIATIYPSRRAARLTPVEGLRYD